MPPTTITLKSPWFGFVACGLKTVELLPARGLCKRLRPGDYVEVENRATGLRIRRRVETLTRHSRVEEALEACGLERALPHCEDLTCGAAFYRRTIRSGSDVMAVHLSPDKGLA